MRAFLLLIISLLYISSAKAQYNSALYSKLSPYVHDLVIKYQQTRCADKDFVTFVSTHSGDDNILKESGCRVLAKMGDVFVVEMPVSSINTISQLPDISRIEAGKSCSVLLDTTSQCVAYDKVRAGIGIPRAYTGKGVVMGIMDVGFDLTHPNFYTRDMSDYRIRKFWDMISPERDEDFVVGRDYVGTDSILSLKHSADNLIISHGTHTLGIAAGSGYNTDYIGVAPESDICLVNNAVTEDMQIIAPEDVEKYTTATDALGFKYIFDYAQSVGKPCVISFSEGSRQLFDEENILYYKALESLVGPGRILVASAGNNGNMKYVLHKKATEYSSGSFVYSPYEECALLIKSEAEFTIKLKSYGSNGVEYLYINSDSISNSENKEFKLHHEFQNATYDISITATPSAFNSSETVYEIDIIGDDLIGARVPLSMELYGSSDIIAYAFECVFMDNELDPSLCDGTSSGTILTPASAPSVIAVGASSYREGFVNYQGEYKTWNNGSGGVIAPYSSLGPTFDGRIKPEVVAPGTNVISSYSSYYIESQPDAFDTQSDVERYQYNGRTYSWNANTGTSMSSPVVAGIIALWLEADPNLSPEDIREIFNATCTRNKDLYYPNNTWGYGEINAYAGLCHVLGIDGIEGIVTESRDFVLRNVQGGFDICFNTILTEDCTVDVFSIEGRKISSHNISQGTSRYFISSPKGVAAVRVLFADRTYQSELVRIK